MGALLWLLIPVLAGLVAALWSSWAMRNRRTGDVAELAGYARFRAAMEKEHATPVPAAAVPEGASDPV
ncbi:MULTISPECIES: hypothetical protein [Streptomyces]|uniref:hypothetical protein n=1 Tax=Streptomyces TaxID=1883 RepID=UPI001966BE56|nr:MULTISPECIES: hypothetical protein [Streptomyces]QRX94182.1 hypothetical protein JNO44_28030 [Streptomyces noursei]UJB43903.1 hypothetical protein HRD51_26620 [Streptomyces sp. A1-5]